MNLQHRRRVLLLLLIHHSLIKSLRISKVNLNILTFLGLRREVRCSLLCWRDGRLCWSTCFITPPMVKLQELDTNDCNFPTLIWPVSLMPRISEQPFKKKIRRVMHYWWRRAPVHAAKLVNSTNDTIPPSCENLACDTFHTVEMPPRLVSCIRRK